LAPAQEPAPLTAVNALRLSPRLRRKQICKVLWQQQFSFSHVALPVRHGGKIEINVFGGFRSPASQTKKNQQNKIHRKRRKFIKNFAASWADRKLWQQRESTETQRNMIGALADCVRGATRMCRRLSKCRHAQITLKDLSLPAAHTPHTHTAHPSTHTPSAKK